MMNNDLISRDALKEKIQEIVEAEMPIDEKWAMGLRHSLKLIDNAPTVDITEEQAIDKLHETGWMQKHDKEMTERPTGEWAEFAKFVASEVCDEYFANYADSFAEVACRKLVKLGLLKLDGDTYRQKGGAE